MQIPLFPLRTVLFPGGLLPLKVFEQRYIDMTKSCLADERPFGVCMIVKGDEVAKSAQAAPPQFANIGTLARITAWEMPQLGILHLATLGGERFKVEHHGVERSGLVVGEVTPIAAEPRVALTDVHQPLVRLLELIAAREGRRTSPSRPTTPTRPGSAIAWPSCCRCRCRSSRACWKSTMPASGSRCSGSS